MNTASTKSEPKYPRIELPKVTVEYSVECPQEVMGELLRYWDWVLTPEGQKVHPDDAKNHARCRRAIKVLLEFFE